MGKRDSDVSIPREQYSYSVEGGKPRYLSSGEPLTQEAIYHNKVGWDCSPYWTN